jgi:hypothetical protein
MMLDSVSSILLHFKQNAYVQNDGLFLPKDNEI